MAPQIRPVETTTDLPKSTTVVVIGGGIVGLMAALTLAERGIPCVVLEKGRIAAEQSSRNLGWIRKTSRAAADIPLAEASDRLWAGMAQRVGADVGYKETGIMFVAANEAEMEAHRRWHASVSGMSLGSQLLSAREIDALAPGGHGKWAGGLYTASDGRAEPTLASSGIAEAAMRKGAVIRENCAARCLSTTAGRVKGVVTEKGEIACEEVILAGGLWSRRFLGNIGISLPILPLICYAFRTAPVDGPSEVAVGGPDFSYRRHKDGGYIGTHRAAFGSPFVLDHALLGLRYIGTLKETYKMIRPILGKPFIDDLKLSRRWSGSDVSPFERERVTDPAANDRITAQALDNLSAVWPAFGATRIVESWGGTMDITPDSMPVISPVDSVPGLTVATGFSGHGFGTAPAAGELAADLATGREPIVDPSPYVFKGA